MTIYLIRHSYCYDFPIYEGVEEWRWSEFNKNMLLLPEGEELAKKLADMAELRDIDVLFSANSTRAIGTAKYIAHKNQIKINVADEIRERDYANDFLIKDIDANAKSYTETPEQVLQRFTAWITQIAHLNYKKVAAVIHAKIMIIYLKSIGFDLEFTMQGYTLKKDGKVLNDENKIANPLLLKIEFENGKFKSLQNIVLDFALTAHPKIFGMK